MIATSDPLIVSRAGSHLPVVSPVDRAISDILKDLTEEESNFLSGLGQPLRCHAGQAVIRAGERGGELFLVLSGTLMQAAKVVGKPSAPPALFLRGDVVGEAPFAVSGIRKTSVVAIEECHLLVLAYPVIDELVDVCPQLAAKLFRNLARIVASRFLGEIGFTVTKTIPPSASPLDAQLDFCPSSS